MHYHNSDVIRAATQIGQIDEHAARFRRRQDADHRAHLRVGYLAAQAIATQKVNITLLHRVRSFNVHLNERLGTERAHNDIARNALEAIRIDAVPPRHLPNQAVVEAHLLDLAGANAISAAIADVADPGTFRPEQQCGRRGAHAAEFGILLPLGVNRGIGFNERLAQGRHTVLGSLLVIGVRDDAHGQLAGQFADRMGPHAVGDYEEMAALLPLPVVSGQQGRMRVLVMAAPDANIGQACVFDRIVAKHQRLPQAPVSFVACMLHRQGRVA